MGKQKFAILKIRLNSINLCLFLFLILDITNIFSQNLVTNPSFEIFSTCPNNIGQVNFATGWFNVPSHPGNPDYLNVCTSVSTIDVPANAFGSQTPSTGNGYLGLVLYYQATPNWREYIETQLTSPMIAGQNYTIQFKASLGDNSQFSTPSFQFYFSNSIFNCVFCGSPITTVTPQISSTTHVTSKTGWTTVTANYTATGGEQYMTFGNFRNDASTTVAPAGAGLYTTAYYYIDDISVIPTTPLPIELTTYDVICSNNKIQLKWTTASEINNNYFTIEQSSDGINYSSAGNVHGAGNSSITNDYSFVLPNGNEAIEYVRLTQTDYNGHTTTFNPKHINCPTTDQNRCPQISFQDKELFISSTNNLHEDMSVSLFKSNGESISQFNLMDIEKENNIGFPIDHITTGIYYVQITNSELFCVSKVFISN